MKKLLIPFVTAGYPSRHGCLDLLKACAAGGADRVELGIPFSDPLADGPVIQATSQKALENGTTLRDAFAIAEEFRERPLLFMSYYNPILQYGLSRYFRRAGKAGVRGHIIPDLPAEESGEARAAAASSSKIVFLCSPTTSADRLRLVDRISRDFIYLVSIKGVTGTAAASGVPEFVRRVRRYTKRPLCVGFGISTPAHAAQVAAVADGVIVGSALLRLVLDGGGPREVERFVASLRRAID